MNSQDIETIARNAWEMWHTTSFKDLDPRTQSALVEAARLGYLAGEGAR